MIFWLCNSIIILSDTLFVASFHIVYHSNTAHLHDHLTYVSIAAGCSKHFFSHKIRAL